MSYIKLKENLPGIVGLIFYKVVNGTLIETGDPLGDGTGGPGFQYEDEIHPDLKFDRPGRVALANSGPSSNGSRFFITVKPMPELDGRHTIFGQVITGHSIVKKISKSKTDEQGKPKKSIVLEKIEIFRVE